jgi:hypothetical protein
MAQRPIFVPAVEGKWPPMVDAVNTEFTWYPGLAVSRKQKSVRSLHESGARIGRILEVSSKSELPLGQELSAFRLQVALADGRQRCVEVVFQCSKRFEHAGPFPNLLDQDVCEVRAIVRRVENGRLQGFVLDGVEWNLVPRTAFYDFVYLSALCANPKAGDALMDFAGFTDIEFNPAKSLNCQARSCALYCALRRAGRLRDVMGSASAFLAAARFMYPREEVGGQQGVLDLL